MAKLLQDSTTLCLARLLGIVLIFGGSFVFLVGYHTSTRSLHNQVIASYDLAPDWVDYVYRWSIVLFHPFGLDLGATLTIEAKTITRIFEIILIMVKIGSEPTFPRLAMPFSSLPSTNNSYVF